MAAPIWQTSTSLAGGSAANAVIAIPGAPLTANDVVLVTIYKESTAAVTPHAGYTQKTATGVPPTTTAPQAQHTFWFRAAGGETGNLTFSWTGAAWRAATAHRITGCVTTGDPIQDIVGAFSNSNVATLAASLAAGTGDTLLYLAQTNFTGGNSYTSPAGFTERSDVDVIGDTTKSNPGAAGSGSVSQTSIVSGPMTTVLLSLAEGGTAPNDAGLWPPASTGIILPQNPLYFPFATPLGVSDASVPGTADAALTGTGTLTAGLALSKSADAALAGTGTLSATATGPERFITSIAGTGNQQYPADQGGSPILVKGDVIWAFPANAGRWGSTWQLDVTNYLDTRQAQGFNLLMIGALGSTQNGGPADTGATFDGVLPFSGGNGVLNNTYWTRVDYIVDEAASRGITVLMNVAYSYDMDTASLSGFSGANYTTYGTNLGNRYKTKTNLIWGVGGDYFDTQQTQIGNLFTAIQATGDTHLISVQNYPETTSRKDISNNGTQNTGVSWSDWNFVYSYNVTYDGVEYAYDETSPIAAIWGDGHFDQNSSGDRVVMRNDIWWAFSSGARGHIYGSEGTWNWASGSLSNASTETVPSTDLAGYWSIFTGLTNWWKLVPDTDSSFVTAGRGTHAAALTSGGGGGEYNSSDPQDQYVTASVAPDGSLAVVYAPVAQTITVNPAELAASYTVRKVDPASGTSSSVTISGTYAISGTNSRGGTDWLLVFEGSTAVSADAALAGTGTLSGTAANAKPVTATLTGTGTLTPSASNAKPADSTLAGTGSLTATTVNAKPASASLAGTGTLTAAATTAASQFADSALAGTGTITPTASSAKPIDAALAGTGTLTPAGTSAKPGDTTLTGTGSLSGIGVSAKPVDASLTGTGTLTAAATTSTPGTADATLAGTGTLTGTGTTAKPVTATLAGTGTVTPAAVREQLPTTALAGTGALSGTAATGKPVDAVLSATGTLTAAASVTTAGPSMNATLTGTGSLSATATIPRAVAVALTGAGTITAQAAVSRSVAAVLVGVGFVSAAGDTAGQITPRPFTGTTARPNTGITERP